MTRDPKAAFDRGDLETAIALATEDVRERPSDAAARLVLCELLAFGADLDRLSDQLDAVVAAEPRYGLSVGVWRRILAGERDRREILEARARSPREVVPWDDATAERWDAWRRGVPSEAAGSGVVGRAGDAEPSEFRDLDDAFAAVLEVLLPEGEYGWIPMTALQRVHVQRPQTLRDLVWAPASVTLASGDSRTLCVPTRYFGTEASPDAALRCGRQTVWVESGRGTVGRGLRCFMLADACASVFELEDVTLGAARQESLGHG